MIKHVVLWQLKEFATEEEKNQKVTEIKSALEALPLKISEIKSLSVGVNVNLAEQYDLTLLTTFDSMEELAVYAKHPDHVAVGAILRPVAEKRACVDYEF